MATRNPPWRRDELILALDLYVRIGLLDDRDPRAVELSEFLARLNAGIARGDSRFRNPNGVAMKLGNFAALDPDYAGDGLRAGSRMDANVWAEFQGRPDELHRAAAALRRDVDL